MLLADAVDGLTALTATPSRAAAKVQPGTSRPGTGTCGSVPLLGHQPLGPTEVLGALNEEMDARDIIVQAARARCPATCSG